MIEKERLKFNAKEGFPNEITYHLKLYGNFARSEQKDMIVITMLNSSIYSTIMNTFKKILDRKGSDLND